MYHVSPFTYIVSAVVGQAIGHQQINCSSIELVSVVPPAGQTCGEYLGPFIAANGGYVVDSSAMGTCSFCSTRTTDEFISHWNIRYDRRWRNFAIPLAFIILNVSTELCAEVSC